MIRCSLSDDCTKSPDVIFFRRMKICAARPGGGISTDAACRRWFVSHRKVGHCMSLRHLIQHFSSYRSGSWGLGGVRSELGKMQLPRSGVIEVDQILRVVRPGWVAVQCEV